MITENLSKTKWMLKRTNRKLSKLPIPSLVGSRYLIRLRLLLKPINVKKTTGLKSWIKPESLKKKLYRYRMLSCKQLNKSMTKSI